jgi:hypothetical protein
MFDLRRREFVSRIGKPSVLQTVSCTPCILSKFAGV